ncbi:3-ketoacyl-CoA thiolase A, peroxisomal-like [Pseudoliparis swirei]|uniref:3-ketoacyl-CoA thiolase A, peroxisomal-like n=1 Tax=Pseudoliparis swirei TaxID=2059687 RepID=UPI0024BD71F8|nr:3-ketoacyl-CoA thiolase A, peroxisomal-like [Pseudoliparis swirei]
MHRLKVISGHLSSSGSPRYTRDVRRTECGSAPGSSPQDVVVVHGPRTAIGKAKRGAFKDTTPDELLSAVMRAVLADVGLPPDRLGDVCVGNVLQPGAGAVMARVAHFLRSDSSSSSSSSSLTHVLPRRCVQHRRLDRYRYRQRRQVSPGPGAAMTRPAV